MNNIDDRVITFAGNVGTRLLVTTAVSPIEYAKTLIQIGFEPLPPIASTTIFGKPAMKLPNVFTYIKYIHSIDGTTGCFRGLTPRLFRTFFLSVAHTYVVDSFSEVKDKDLEKATDEEEKLRIFRKILARDLVATSTAIVVSQPFHVVGVRMMAQFVGRETKYTGVFSSLYQIYQDEGVSGLFSGLVTRLIGELCTVFFVSTVTFVVKTYIITDDKTVQQVVTLGIDFMIKNLMYPFQVLDVCMAVNGSGLKAGSPPLMPNYSGNWLKCWSDLTSSNQAKRGSSLIWRYHNPPAIKTHFSQVPFPDIPKNR